MTAKKVQSIDIAELRRRAEDHLGMNNESADTPGTMEEEMNRQQSAIYDMSNSIAALPFITTIFAETGLSRPASKLL